MTELPPGWEIVRLHQIADVRLGRQRSPKNHTGSQMRPYLRAANVGWDGLKLDDVKEMNFTDAEAEVYRLQAGDLVLSEASGSASEVGKPALWNGEIEDCCFQNTLIRVRSFGVLPKYLLYFLRSEALRGAFAGNSRGVGIHHLGAARMSSWPVPIPPLAEQHRIVDVLEGHLSHLEAAVSNLQISAERLERLRKEVIVTAVPIPPPSNWIMSTVADSGKVELGRQRHPDWHHGPHMRPYLRVANVFEDRIDTSDLMEMDFPPRVFDKFRLLKGDILLNEGQSPEYLGRPAMYRGEPKDIAFTNSLLRFQVNPDVLPEWALLVFRRHMHAGRFIREVRITTNIAHLSAGRLKSIEFPIPPLEEQEQIVERTREKLEATARLQKVVTRAEYRAAHIRQSLLSQAFAGRLVHQDPSDEPATALIERIRTELEVTSLKPRAKHAKTTAMSPRARNAVQETLL